jgi:ATP-binding cassette, subfamily B, bacterial
MTRDRYSELALYKRLLEHARPYWLHVLGIFGLSLLSTPLVLLTPLPLKIVVDSVLGSHPLPGFLQHLFPSTMHASPAVLLAIAVGLLVPIALLLHVQGLAIWMLTVYTGERLVQDFRAELFRHAQRLSLSYHDSKGATDSTYRIQYDTYSIDSVIISGVIPLISALVTLLGMIYVTARMDWQLAFIALTVSPILFALTRIFGHRLHRRWKEIKLLDSSAMSVIQEVLSSVRVVKAFVREEYESQRFVSRAQKRMSRQIQAAFFQGSFDLAIGMTMAIGTAAALFVGVLHVRSRILTLGELLIVMAYLAQLYEPLKTLSKKVADLQSGLAGAQRVFSVLDELPEVVEQPDALALLQASGGIAFRNVAFSYDGETPILRDISFEIAAGTRLGISGATGAGKTTLVNLLTRFYDPTAGQILLDGIDLRDYRLADLRNQCAIVLQDPVLFSASIRENIAYARPGAADEDIVFAAKAANAHGFITRLPEGYDTLVGERGMRLSGGERQRISIARAFLKGARILILDEPTSSVDLGTEASILEALDHLMQGRTTIMIAHRLSTLDICDAWIEIEHGRILRATGNIQNLHPTRRNDEAREEARWLN